MKAIGSIGGKVTVTTNQLLNNAVRCVAGATNYITLPNTVLNPGPSDVLSISGWFYCVTISSGGTGYIGIISNRNATPGFRGFAMSYDKNFKRFNVQHIDNAATNTQNFVGFSIPTSDTNIINKWNHFVFTKSGLSAATYSFYLNGVSLTGTINNNALVSGSTTTNSNPVKINDIDAGVSLYLSTAYFSNYQIYSKALIQAEVTSLYNLPLTIPATALANLTAWYPFTEHRGQSIVDTVAANNGSLLNYTGANTGTPANPQSGNTTWYEYLKVPISPITV